MLAASKGFGSAKPKRVVNKKAILKDIKKKYGGTSAQDIAKGTQRNMEKTMRNLPQHLQVATQLYQKLTQWNQRLDSMSILDQASIPTPEMEGARRAQDELNQILDTHNLSEHDLHNIFQQLTWDASADAKMFRAISGSMPKDIQDRVDRACQLVVKPVLRKSNGRVLDVGCGFGTLEPNLKAAGLQSKQIYGVDLSPEMIRNAKQLYPECYFEAADFYQYNGPEGGFDGILFCSALHDMPDPVAAIKKAAELLQPSGVIVVVHAQGAAHVEKQAQANPVLVKRGLLSAEELSTVAAGLGLSLTREPAKAHTPQDTEEGYLAVLCKD